MMEVQCQALGLKNIVIPISHVYLKPNLPMCSHGRIKSMCPALELMDVPGWAGAAVAQSQTGTCP